MPVELAKKRRAKLQPAKTIPSRLRKPLKSFSSSKTKTTSISASEASTAVYPRPNLPRLYFSGKFYCDPCTTNNNVEYYDVNTFRPNYQIPDDGVNSNGFWNPTGTMTFAFVDCDVSGTYSSATQAAPSTPDVLVGQDVVYNRRTVYGKISDLDAQMQVVSTLFGVRVNIGSGDDTISALLEPTSFRDMWGAVYNDPNAVAYIQGYGAVYQGVLKIDDINSKSSTFLAECQPYIDASKELTDASGQQLYPNGALSIRFRVDQYDNDPSSQTFCYGNISAIITPWLSDMPKTFDAGRKLELVAVSAEGDPTLANTAYAYVQTLADGTPSLYVDLINSLYREAPTEYTNLGIVEVVYFPSGYANSSSQYVSLGTVDYSDPTFEATSGIVQFSLSAEDCLSIENAPLGVVSTSNGVQNVLLAEANDGYFVRADTFVFRLNPGPDEKEDATFYVTKFGKRVATDIVFGFDSTSMANTGMGSGGPVPGVPASALIVNSEAADVNDPNGEETFFTSIITDANGIGTLSLEGGDCGTPRVYVDGQMYGIRYGVGSTFADLPDRDENVPGSDKLNIHLYDVYDVPEKPSWISDVLPIFKQYANLYVAMERIVCLDDFGSVSMRKKPLLLSFSVDEEDPMYMPTTRDLSKKKREMLVKFLDVDGELNYLNETVDDVKLALQTIMELEHATMPPYLTALFSIKPGYNQYIADTLRDISEQEMLHFSLVCNMLISIGGQPEINKIGFVPKYPGTLPGGLRSGLIVRLRKCSIEQIKAFMAIEAPYEQYLLDDSESTMDNPLQQNKYTIGWLYDAVAAIMTKLQQAGTLKFPVDAGASDTDDVLKNQVTNMFGGKLFQITSLDDALRAINEIKEEGEGSPATNNPADSDIDPDTGLPMIAHYFRFAEIVKGRRIVVDHENGSYSYTGPKVELDEAGVYNMQDDPKLQEQPADSMQRERMESFCRKYQGLLNGLQITFGGDPDYINKCMGMMFQLTIAAQPLMEMPAMNLDGSLREDGTTCGVSFQVPTDPGAL